MYVYIYIYIFICIYIYIYIYTNVHVYVQLHILMYIKLIVYTYMLFKLWKQQRASCMAGKRASQSRAKGTAKAKVALPVKKVVKKSKYLIEQARAQEAIMRCLPTPQNIVSLSTSLAAFDKLASSLLFVFAGSEALARTASAVMGQHSRPSKTRNICANVSAREVVAQLFADSGN